MGTYCTARRLSSVVPQAIGGGHERLGQRCAGDHHGRRVPGNGSVVARLQRARSRCDRWPWQQYDQAAERQLRPDTTPPTIVIEQPTEGQVVHTSSVLVRGTVSDESWVSEVRVNGTLASLVGGTFQATVGLVAGANHIEVTATDQPERGDGRP